MTNFQRKKLDNYLREAYNFARKGDLEGIRQIFSALDLLKIKIPANSRTNILNKYCEVATQNA